MVSTYKSRIAKARNLLSVLFGDAEIGYYGTRKPDTLPVGVNYTSKEWNYIREAKEAFRWGRDISIQLIFELEDMEKKYQNDLFLAKLHK